MSSRIYLKLEEEKKRKHLPLADLLPFLRLLPFATIAISDGVISDSEELVGAGWRACWIPELWWRRASISGGEEPSVGDRS